MDTSVIDEEWRAVPGYEGRYAVSNLGTIRSLKRPKKSGTYWPARNLKQVKALHGNALTVTLSKDGRTQTLGVHRVVALAFHGESWGMDARHIDGDSTNNRANNIEWRPPINRLRPEVLTPQEARRRRQIKRLGLSEYIRSNLDDRAHGTKATYDRHKCRCEKCRQANNDYMRAYRENRRAA